MNALGRILVVVMMSGVLAGCASLPTGSDEPRAKLERRSGVLDVRTARKQLPGKTMPEVLNAVGSPDRQTGNSQWEWWTYEETFFDPITKRTLPVVTFVFRGGRLLEITF